MLQLCASSLAWEVCAEVFVDKVERNGSAWQAGTVKKGDIVRAIEGKDVRAASILAESSRHDCNRKVDQIISKSKLHPKLYRLFA